MSWKVIIYFPFLLHLFASLLWLFSSSVSGVTSNLSAIIKIGFNTSASSSVKLSFKSFSDFLAYPGWLRPISIARITRDSSPTSSVRKLILIKGE